MGTPLPNPVPVGLAFGKEALLRLPPCSPSLCSASPANGPPARTGAGLAGPGAQGNSSGARRLQPAHGWAAAGQALGKEGPRLWSCAPPRALLPPQGMAHRATWGAWVTSAMVDWGREGLTLAFFRCRASKRHSFRGKAGHGVVTARRQLPLSPRLRCRRPLLGRSILGCGVRAAQAWPPQANAFRAPRGRPAPR